MIARRHFLAAAATGLSAPALARSVDLGLPGGPSGRPLTRAFPGKGEMILQRTTPPLLETPMAVFDAGVFTPNDRFFVRWHWPFPTEIDPAAFRLKIDGHVGAPVSLSLAELAKLPEVEIAAVNQCAGNSRGVFEPRVAGAQWRHGAMGNARWRGVRLRDVLDRAGVSAGAVAVRFSGLDTPLVDDAPDFQKSLGIDHARGGEVMLATHMNGAPLPLLNGFPLRLVVPGWYSTYWAKMLDRIEVLAAPDDNYWMAKAYLVPATPDGGVAPGNKDFARRPISAMVPRSFITNIADGARLPWRPQLPVGGIALGGDAGVAKVEVSADGGATWAAARLGPDAGKYSFRRFDALVAPARGAAVLMARCTNTAGAVQAMAPMWNPNGFMRGQVETVRVVLA
ncbi:MAG: molybdopterin-dependent oxidoreductase [Sandarakinorhabdus sp.]|nr:molybdopterin-dependent oxidoreductase [Sandarakinorhabdus sp.]